MCRSLPRRGNRHGERKSPSAQRRFCDGLGDCLPACPADAIRFVEREAAAYDAEAVRAHQKHKNTAPLPCGCPGTQARELRPHTAAKASAPSPAPTESQLRQWPVQIKLVPVQAPYYENAELLIAADCTAYAYAGFHQDFMKGKITLMGCPKLDSIDYTEKLTEIIRQNTIKNVTVVRMEVPCCGGIEQAVVNAVQNSGKKIPCQIITLSTQGKIL